MTFNIHLLDDLSYEDADALLEKYIDDVIQEFANSTVGQAHIEQHPTGGDWISAFIQIGHIYGEQALSHMDSLDVQELMETIIPRKLTIENPNEISHAMVELIAFWRFLKESYTFPEADAIIKYLHSIEDEFAELMLAAYEANTAENSIMQGNATGQDIATDQRVDPLRALQLGLMMGEQGTLALSEQDSTLLKKQTITPDEPGTVLKDFEMLLDRVGPKGIIVSGKLRQFPMKTLADINERLSRPIAIGLKRPQQKAYAPIHGLYLLLRATGLISIKAKGKKHQLVLNEAVYEQWKRLNPTERYLTLLEAWLVRAKEEMLGERNFSRLGEGDRCLNFWTHLAEKKTVSFKGYDYQDILGYSLGYHNVALMEMFGFLDLTSGKPQTGKGWRIRKLATLPFGNAMMALFKTALLAKRLHWASAYDATVPYNELQPFFARYFPAWQQALILPTQEFRPGRHIFKVHLGKCWRRIAIDAEATLYVLSRYILDSVDFDYDHMDQFKYKDVMGCTVKVDYPSEYMEGLATDEVKIGDLPIPVGGTMDYLFDFGDRWLFEVQLESIDPPETEESNVTSNVKKGNKSAKATKKTSKRKPQGEILESHGEAPEQYPFYDD